MAIGDNSVFETQEIDLEVINDECVPDIDVSNIDIEDSYTYSIGDGDQVLIDVADFSCGDCKT